MKIFDTIIIGGGLSGLVVGHTLKKSGQNILFIEKSPRVGGALRTEKKAGFLLEVGPNTVLAKPEILDLIEQLRLTNKLITAPKKSPRFIQYNNRLHKLPPGPLSLFHLLRALGEPFIKKGYALDESIWSFFERRFGRTIAERIISPFVSGVWAGDAKKLSIQSAFPQLAEMEMNHGSVIRGLLKSKKEKKTQTIKGLISFQDGIETLVRELSKNLEGDILTNSQITSVSPSSQGTWDIHTQAEKFYSKNLVFSCPTFETAELIKPLFPAAANTLKNIPYAPIKVLHLGFTREDIDHPLKGFGYLTVPSESKNILGCLWSSSLFPNRAPEGSVLLTLFLGGMTNPGITKKNDTELLDLALNDISSLLGIKARPYFTQITSYEKAIPQYTLGHGERRKAIMDLQQANPGLWFSGNYLDGVSVGDVIKNAVKTADQLQKSARD